MATRARIVAASLIIQNEEAQNDWQAVLCLICLAGRNRPMYVLFIHHCFVS